MIGSFHFLRPGWLLLLPLALGLLLLLAWHADPRRAWRRFIAPELLAALVVEAERGRALRPVHGLGAFLLLGILALAGPAWREQDSPFTEDAAALVIVLEVTPSMRTTDVQPSRLERAVQKIHDLLAARRGAPAALVAYAGSAHLVMPLTRDPALIEGFARALDPGLMPRAGDDPVPAVELAARLLAGSTRGGSVLLITDGIDSAVAERLGALRADASLDLLLLGALGPDADEAERRALHEAASEAGAQLRSMSPDARDVERIVAAIAHHFEDVAVVDGGRRWRDDGYWLLLPVCLVALLGFRRGWVVTHA